MSGPVFGYPASSVDIFFGQEATAHTHMSADITDAQSAVGASQNKIIKRDAAGRAQVDHPVEACDIATKKYIDDKIPAGTSGYLVTQSGTAGTLGTAVNSATWQKTQVPAGIATTLLGNAYAITLLTGQTAAAGTANTAAGAFGIFITATSAGTARTVMIRDENGRAQVANPSAANDIVNNASIATLIADIQAI